MNTMAKLRLTKLTKRKYDKPLKQLSKMMSSMLLYREYFLQSTVHRRQRYKYIFVSGIFLFNVICVTNDLFSHNIPLIF